MSEIGELMQNKAGRRGGVSSWLVEPYRQVKLGLMFLLVNLVFSVLIFSVFGYYILDMYDALTGLIRLTQDESLQMLSKFHLPIVVGGVLVLIFIVTTLFVSVRYTYQIYGPLVSIHRFLDELLEGKMPSKIGLRSSDQLQDLANKLNSVAERMLSDGKEGPLVAIHRCLDDMCAGKDFKKIKLRDGDLYYELADKVNALVDRLDAKKSE